MGVPVIPLASDCGVFTKGKGEGIYFGLDLSMELYKDWISGYFRPYYELRPATLQETSSGYEVLAPITNSYEPLVRSHEWTGNLEYLLLDMGFRFKPMSMLSAIPQIPEISFIPLYLKFGFEAGDPIVGTEFTNSEEIVSPGGVLFPDQTLRREVSSGEIMEAGTSMALNFGGGFDIDLDGGLRLSPEFIYRYELNSPIEEYDWAMDMFRVGLTVSWRYSSKQKVIEEVEEIPIVEEVEQEIVIVEKVEDKKPEIIQEPSPEIISLEGNKLNIVQTIVTQTYPILPYIFFDNNSSDIRKIYSTKAKGFKEANLPKNTVGIYYNILDIIGSRMKENPEAIITLTGTTDGRERDTRSDLYELARLRANSISFYLQDKWGISRNRLKVEFREFPLLATSSVYDEGFEENRRVEISSNDPEILKPVLHSKFLEYTADKNSLEFESEFRNTNDFTKLEMELYLDGEIIGRTGRLPASSKVEIISFAPSYISEIGSNMTSSSQLRGKLMLFDSSGIVSSKTIDIPLSKEENDFEVGRLNLIVFDFDKADISYSNQQMINTFISSGIKANSETTVTGSTDKLGEARYNKNLSQKRADTVADYILNLKSDYKFEDVIGIGSSSLPFDNSTPEGRFYCRTVLIEVKTPID